MKKIFITIGDPGSISPEIIIKTLNSEDFHITQPLIIFTPLSVFKEYEKYINFEYKVINSINNIKDNRIYLFDISSFLDNTHFEIAKVDKNNGLIAAKSIEIAVSNISNRDVLITAPISKEAINMAGYNFPGHTEFLAYLNKKDKNDIFMSFWGEINTLLLTTHIPMKDMIEKVSSTDFIYKKIKKSYPLIKRILNKQKPKIAICGLNPHAGENSLISDEEEIMSEV